MAKPDPIQQLRSVNEVLAHTLQADAEQVEHARRAIDFYEIAYREATAKPLMKEGVETLARVHLNHAESGEVAFAHWHAPASEHFSPLWIRAAIISEMMKLSGSRKAMLMVTSLRDAICPDGNYWTKARESRFRRVREWIEQLACSWATPGSQLQVIVL
ncbi:MAG: hypothetical protein AAGH40_01185 [Verrucomicrobiota bacterium]